MNLSRALVVSVFAAGCASPWPDGAEESRQRLDGQRGDDCGTLSPDECRQRADCELGPDACAQVCRDDGQGGCLPCAQVCRFRSSPPPADPCATLTADECAAKVPFCAPLWECPGCDASTGEGEKTCRDQECSYRGCQLAPTVADRCIGLGERACNEASGCKGRYALKCEQPPVDASTGGNDSTGGRDGCAELFAGCERDQACRP